MNDRISNHPNRWRLIPVTGQEGVYDFERADDPTVTGTPLNKATFLPDDIADAIEALTSETINLPADALNALTAALDTMGLLYSAKIQAFSYSGTGGKAARTTTFTIHPRVVFYIRDGGYIGQSRNSNTNSTITCPWQIWVYDSSGGDGITFSYSEMNQQLTRTRKDQSYYTDADYATKLMNSSGVTYYIVAIGVK